MLRTADVLMLSEVDNGLGRSHNRNVARELADALGMSYAFAVSYVTLEDDHLENPEGRENTLALAGSAILSRAPIRRVINADLPELRDKFSSSEKRLGKKRAVIEDALTRLNRELDRRYGVRLANRTGVNTGEVVVRTIETGGHTEYTPVGHVTNLAARMQTAAPAGSIAVSEATQRLCEGYFEFRALGPTAVKGLSAPVEAAVDGAVRLVLETVEELRCTSSR